MKSFKAVLCINSEPYSLDCEECEESGNTGTIKQKDSYVEVIHLNNGYNVLHRDLCLNCISEVFIELKVVIDSNLKFYL